MRFSRDVIKGLLETSLPQQRELGNVYALLPATHCRRRTHCCSMLPEMTLLEALVALRQLLGMPLLVRERISKNIIRYFLLNPVEVTACPFLDGRDCLIYGSRFFGCRAYGLWSLEYYKKLAEHNRRVKKDLEKQWEHLGVRLPQRVIDFVVPYCQCVEAEKGAQVDDKMLVDASGRIEMLSCSLSPWHESFRLQYFSDLSFLISSLVFSLSKAVHLKFAVVRDLVTTANKTTLDKILGEPRDLFAELTS